MTTAITNVRLPIPLEWPPDNQSACATIIGEELVTTHNMQVITFSLHSRVYEKKIETTKETHWARISAQVYLEKADFYLLGTRILSIAAGCRGPLGLEAVSIV
mmetsp:Transcript_76732/g.172045  ORF Transcript_76732/g.172045 Transcript_76732/m.172045 type:complete len:103 (+) Transcript_76732:1-309(+)